MKIDLYQCDNNFCKDEAETRTPDESGWYVVCNGSDTWHFHDLACVMAWLQERIER